jgi:16S rRNA (cytosine967-C5)-methyltransferase
VLETQRLASTIVAAVHGGRALNAAFAITWPLNRSLTKQQRAAITDICYGTLRFGAQLDGILKKLLAKPLNDEILRWLLQVALYQLIYTRAASHAIVDHAVRCASSLGAPQAAGLVNGVLRNFLRQRKTLIDAVARSDTGRYSYPQWWIDKLRSQYPDEAAQVLESGNLHPPFTLRVNRRRISRADYMLLLTESGIDAIATKTDAVTLARAIPVERVPGFSTGMVSVQDAAAQQAAPLLDAQGGMCVLDACAAPGGKTTHLLEIADVNVTAVDNNAGRLERVSENLQRLGLEARLLVADVSTPGTWWDGKPYDRILADLPCSASGVVRRHPDIKWLRRAADIPQFALQQKRMLDSLWQMLAGGGKLLYTTCSIFEEENSLQVADFLAHHADATVLPLPGMKSLDGRREGLLLPNNEHDGFFYALLQKI